MPHYEISLLDLIKILIRYKFWILVFPVNLTVFALIIASQMNQILEGSVSLDISDRMETPPWVIARVQSTPFVEIVWNHVGINSEFGKELFKTSLKAVNPLMYRVEIKLRGYTTEMVKKLLIASVEQLQLEHSEILISRKEFFNKRVQVVNDDIQAVNSEIEFLHKLMDKAKQNISSYIDATAILYQRTKEKRKLEIERRRVVDKWAFEDAYPPKIIGDYYVSKIPVFPNYSKIGAIVFFIGLCFSIVVAYVHNLLKKEEYLSK